MNHKIENEQISVSVKEAGAELISIKKQKDDFEYLWSGDGKFWNRIAPVLFPIVGMLKDNAYTYEGKPYSLPQHGFARDNDFKVIEEKKDKIIFQFTDNEETMKKFPFKFAFNIEYTLKKNAVIIGYRVKNTGNAKMYFSVGAHPGFATPLNNDLKIEDYYLQFEKKETVTRYFLDNGLQDGKTETLLEQSDILKLSAGLLNPGVIIIKNPGSKKVALKNTKNKRAVIMEYPGFEYFGFWTKSADAQFLCLEPWFGIADSKTSGGDFTKKEGIKALEAGKEFYCEYSVSVE